MMSCTVTCHVALAFHRLSKSGPMQLCIISLTTISVRQYNEISCRPQSFDTFIRLAAAEKGSIRAAQNIIQKSTCIKFRRIYSQIKIKDYVNIKPGFGCASTVGFLGGEQIIYIQKSVKTFFN